MLFFALGPGDTRKGRDQEKALKSRQDFDDANQIHT